MALPDTEGRLQIINIHTANMRAAKRITDEAIDRLPALAGTAPDQPLNKPHSGPSYLGSSTVVVGR